MHLSTILRPLLLLLTLGLAFGEEPAAKLPPEAQKLVAAFDADATKLRADAEAAVEKKAALLANQLQLVQEKLTKKGDLDGAMAVKAKIAGLSKGEVEKPALPTHDDTVGGKYVVLYNEVNYGGTSIKVQIPCSPSNVVALGFPNDALRSIQVPQGVTVHLYENENGGGVEWAVKESVADLTGSPRVGTTSISINRR